MASLAIDVGGKRIAAIGLAGLDLVSVFVHGALDREQKATFDAHGGNYAEGACGHLVWVEDRALLPGELVIVSLQGNCGVEDPGKTNTELARDEDASSRTDYSISAGMAADLRARPRLHEAFLVQVETSSGQAAEAASDERNTGFQFSVLWNRMHPDQARLRLSTSCLDDVLARTGGTEHLRSMLSVGESVSIVLLR